MTDTVVRAGGALRFQSGDPVDSAMIRHGTGTVAADLASLDTRLAALDAAWTSYTPTNTNVTVGNGTLYAAYIQAGKTTTFVWALLFGSSTSLGGTIDIGLPVGPNHSTGGRWSFSANYSD